MDETYYFDGLRRQASALYARQYLGIQDASGNNLLTNFNSSVVTAGYVVNTIPLWQDVRIPMSSMRTGASGITFTNFRGTVRAPKFTTAASDDLEFDLQIPHGFNESAIYGLRLHVHWATDVATGLGSAVRWNVETTVADIGQVFNTPTITYNVLAHTLQGFEHTVTAIHTFTGLHDSAVISGRIFRGGAGDTFAAANSVWGLSLDAHYVVQKVGSLDEIGD